MFNDFISKEKRSYKFKIGSTIASSLTGFIFGVIVASIVWAIGFGYMSKMKDLQFILEQML
jgi:hypothetical protein